MTKVRIVAAVVDTKQITLYKDDGKTIEIPQGDQRVRKIIDQVLPIVETGGVAEVDLDFPNHYRDFQELSGGAIQFFRVARKVVDKLFAVVEEAILEDAAETMPAEPIPAGQFGSVPAIQSESQEAPKTEFASAVDEIIANATPVTDPGYSAIDTQDTDTMVAIVDDKVITGVEALKDQLAHSAGNRDAIGVQNLLKRMANYVGERRHSVEDLLRFLERGDLPIADDGSIIAYKILRRKGDHYVDCHTQKVPQKVGSFVCVDETLVDKNRRNECSNGLHIARRGYVGTFGGDVVTLCKIAPEDVIVVPHNDPNKVRVCGYHILAELPDSAFSELKRNRPMTENKDMARLLGRVLKGQHIERLEEVKITEQKGGGIKVTQLKGGKPVKASVEAKPAKALDAVGSGGAAPVDPKTVANQVTAAKAPASRQEQARSLWNAYTSARNKRDRWQAATDLVAFKKRSKVAWPVLGIDLEASAALVALANTPQPDAPAPKVPVKSQPVPTPKAEVAKATALAENLAAPTGTRSEIAKQLFKAKNWTGLAAHKKQAKVSWEKLGFSGQQIEQLTKAIAKLG
jgi:hypothetical protein